MERNPVKDRFTEKYLRGLRSLPDNDLAISNYRTENDSTVKKLFGGWMNFSAYVNEYQDYLKSVKKVESGIEEINQAFTKPNQLESMTQDSEIKEKDKKQGS